MRSQAVVVLPGPREFPVRTVDISATGLGIVAAANPSVGTTFAIRFALPLKGKTPAVHEASARVVHSVFSSDEDGFKIGLLFTQLTPSCAAAIVQYIGEATLR